ncbi:hypothetical protein K466DRAFT_356269 [Polyporus arcularius HHB13444]|uniref:Uncharacterized protein n=1 Tax=Polyporus arcularius HHB13444 TaxID=1314778 RepID=A0A5C3PRF6_9APHY|nr:hypothetical protein K466DRAFT_356269 [Polyporus arcularius HHB13444]
MLATTRPTFPRSFSSGYDADGKYELVHSLRHTQSVPASYPSTRPWGQRQRALTGLPEPASKPTTRPQAQRAATTPAAATPETPPRPQGGVPMRRAGFGVGGPDANVDVRPRLRHSPTLLNRVERRSSTRGTVHTHAIPLLSNVIEEDSDASDDDREMYARYRFLPPGLSSPVPWETSRNGTRLPPSLDVTPTPSRPGLRPTRSRMGSHVHNRRLDHGAGGNADEDVFFRTPRPLLTPTRPTRPRGHSVSRRVTLRLVSNTDMLYSLSTIFV